MQAALEDVCLDYGDVLAALQVGGYDKEDEDEFESALPATVAEFCEYWPPVLRGLLIFAREALTRRETLSVEGKDLALLATLAARRRPGQTEPISTAEYLHDMIAQKAEQAGVSLETEE